MGCSALKYFNFEWRDLTILTSLYRFGIYFLIGLALIFTSRCDITWGQIAAFDTKGNLDGWQMQ